MDSKTLSSEKVFLTSLQKKVFKLLPMREDFDKGIDNHLKDYLDNVCAGCKGAMSMYDNLGFSTEYLDIVSNLQYLSSYTEVPFKAWRATVLRSLRILSEIISEKEGE